MARSFWKRESISDPRKQKENLRVSSRLFQKQRKGDVYLKEMKCLTCGELFYCHGDIHCHEKVTECYCKKCAIKTWGKNKDAIDFGSFELCYGGIPDTEVVHFD